MAEPSSSTTSKYYTPAGESIHERGIEPDVPVAMAPGLSRIFRGPGSAVEMVDDNQLQEALRVLGYRPFMQSKGAVIQLPRGRPSPYPMLLALALAVGLGNVPSAASQELSSGPQRKLAIIIDDLGNQRRLGLQALMLRARWPWPFFLMRRSPGNSRVAPMTGARKSCCICLCRPRR